MPSESPWGKTKSEGDWNLVNWKPEQRKERCLLNPHQGQTSTLVRRGATGGSLPPSDATHPLNQEDRASTVLFKAQQPFKGGPCDYG